MEIKNVPQSAVASLPSTLDNTELLDSDSTAIDDDVDSNRSTENVSSNGHGNSWAKGKQWEAKGSVGVSEEGGAWIEE